MKTVSKRKLITSGILILLIIAVGIYFGYVVNQVEEIGDTIFSPTMDTLYLLLRLLLAIVLVAIAAGLVAALIRPIWVCFIAFFISGLALFLICGPSLISLGIAVLYFIGGLLYSLGVTRGLDERIKFSERPIQDNQMLLFIVLIIVVCGLFYSGYSDQTEEEGFTVPPVVMDMAMKIVEGELEANPEFTPENREQIIIDFKQQLELQIEDWIEPYEQYIPAAVAVSLLGTLITISQIISWLPIIILKGIFILLTACRVTRLVSETREVTRLTLD